MWIRKVRMGILGPGGIAHRFAKACEIVSEVEIVAVASTNMERAEAFTNEHQIGKFYGNYQELLEDDEVDAVYIAVVNSLHWEVIELAAHAGKAILCEKPAVLNRGEAKRLSELLAQTNILFMEALWTLHLPAIKKAKEWV